MDLNAARKAAGLNPLPHTKPTEDKKEPGHGRTNQRQVLHNPGGSPELRGVPLVGAGPGCIAGTRPGDSAAQLNQAARDIVIANLALQKAKAEKLRQVRADIKQKPTTRT